VPLVEVHPVAREEFLQTRGEQSLAGPHEQVGEIREERTGLNRAGPLLRQRGQAGREVSVRSEPMLRIIGLGGCPALYHAGSRPFHNNDREGTGAGRRFLTSPA